MDPLNRRLALADWSEFERRCQKPDHRRIGNWMARRVSRPMALRVTRIIAPLGISAHAMTIIAWLLGLAAAAAFGGGTIMGIWLGAAMLQLWYLLDHVDGQLARLRGTACLDGVQLDYLMHHTLNLLIPIGIGWGLASCRLEAWWHLVGLCCGVSLLLAGLHQDARCKAFQQRLKRVQGELRVIGGGGAKPCPAPKAPRRPVKLAIWSLRKSCEMHVVMNSLTILAVVSWCADDARLQILSIYLGLLATAACALTLATLIRSTATHQAEREFGAWYQPAKGCQLVFRDGWWMVEHQLD